MDKTFYIEEKLDPRLLESLFAFPDAVVGFMELIDNSISAKLPGKKMRITILLTNEKLRITDINGTAMDKEALENCFIWGRSEATGVTRWYGQGGKAAFGFLAKDVIIWSTPPTPKVTYVVHLPNYRERWQKELPPIRVDVEPPYFDKSSLQIELREPRVKINRKKLARRISSHYAPLLRRGEVEIYISTGERRMGEKVEPLELPIELCEEFEEMTEFGVVKGRIGLKKEKAAIRGGIRCYSGHIGRLIEEHQTFGLEEDMSLNTDMLIGEVDQDFVPYVRDKTAFQKDTLQWEAFATVMKSKSNPLLS